MAAEATAMAMVMAMATVTQIKAIKARQPQKNNKK